MKTVTADRRLALTLMLASWVAEASTTKAKLQLMEEMHDDATEEAAHAIAKARDTGFRAMH